MLFAVVVLDRVHQESLAWLGQLFNGVFARLYTRKLVSTVLLHGSLPLLIYSTLPQATFSVCNFLSHRLPPPLQYAFCVCER